MSTGAGASDLLHAEDPGLDQMVRGETAVAARSPHAAFLAALPARQGRDRRSRLHRHAGPRRDLRRRDHASGRGACAERAADVGARRLRSPRGSEQRAHHGRRPDRRATSSRACSTARACRSSLPSSAPACRSFFGVILGVIAGFYRGWADTIIARSLDVMLAFPVLLFGARGRRPRAPARTAASAVSSSQASRS